MSRRALKAWGPAILYAALIFALSSLSRPEEIFPRLLLSYDKLVHLGEYAVLGAVLARALGGGGRGPGLAFAAALLLGSLYGASDELHQSFVPGRSSEVLDWVADTAGVALGAAAFAFLRRRGGAD